MSITTSPSCPHVLNDDGGRDGDLNLLVQRGQYNTCKIEITRAKCRHHKDADARIQRDGKKKIWQIERLIKNAAKLCYISHQDLVPLPGIQENPSKRKKRIEFEKALSWFLQAAFDNMDLETRRVAHPKNGKYRDATLEFLAIRAGLHISSAKRAYQALSDAGLIEASKQIRKLKNGVYKCYTTVKHVNLELLELFGMSRSDYHTFKHEKEKQREIEHARKDYLIIQKMLKDAKKKLKSSNKAKKAENTKSTNLQNFSAEERRRLQYQAMKMHELTPSISISEHLLMLINAPP